MQTHAIPLPQPLHLPGDMKLLKLSTDDYIES